MKTTKISENSTSKSIGLKGLILGLLIIFLFIGRLFYGSWIIKYELTTKWYHLAFVSMGVLNFFLFISLWFGRMSKYLSKYSHYFLRLGGGLFVLTICLEVRSILLLEKINFDIYYILSSFLLITTLVIILFFLRFGYTGSDPIEQDSDK
ncbi:hypothetical protein H8D57_00490 [bacterium]|nr:hypothetical protein [bacterium]